MGAAGIELPYFVNARTVENAYRYVKIAQERGRDTIMQQGMRAAKARDPKLLLALQRGAEVLEKMQADQGGRFDVGGINVDYTELQLWRNAAIGVDNGCPEDNYGWIYAAAGILAGVVVP